MKDLILKESLKTEEPIFLFDLKELDIHVKKIKEILGKDINLCYSIKANPFLTGFLEGKIEKLEVCSPGELEICKRKNINSSKIVYSGVNKGEKDILDAINYNCGEYTAESLKHIEILNNISGKNKKKIKVLLRLSSGNQFGMSKEDIELIIKNRKNYINVEIEGIHYFAGTQRKNIKLQQKDIENLKNFYKEIEDKFSYKFKKLEYGPGLGVNLFENEKKYDIYENLKEFLSILKNFDKNIEITIEMGRFLVTDCGKYITKVMDIKKVDGINYAILNGGINHLNYYGQVLAMKKPKIQHYSVNKNKNEIEKWCLCGSLCTAADVIIKDIEFKNLSIDDIIVFEKVGAYSITEGIYLFLSRKLPKVLALDTDNNIKILREEYDISILNTSKI